jgi:hypothetical protein
MTAFGAPVAGSVERFDVHLADVEFLPAQYQRAFDELVRQIFGMRRESDMLAIPSSNEARAWQKAFSIYASLKRREADEERRAVPMQRAFLDDQKAWREYIDDRNRLLSMLRHGEVDEYICASIWTSSPMTWPNRWTKRTNGLAGGLLDGRAVRRISPVPYVGGTLCRLQRNSYFKLNASLDT